MHNQEPARCNLGPPRNNQGPIYNQQRTHSQGPRHGLEAAKEVGMWRKALTNNLKTEHKHKDEGHSQAHGQTRGQNVKFTFLGQNLTTTGDEIIGQKTKCYIISTKTMRDIVMVD